jgi:hypothetical protein
MQVRYAAGPTQHLQKALEQMNVKLTEVVSSRQHDQHVPLGAAAGFAWPIREPVAQP